MALADPQSVASVSLALTKPEPTRSTYESADGTRRFIVSNTLDKSKSRYLIKSEVDFVNATTGKVVTLVVYIVADVPTDTAVDDTDAKDEILALGTWCSASSAANLIKVLGNQH